MLPAIDVHIRQPFTLVAVALAVLVLGAPNAVAQPGIVITFERALNTLAAADLALGEAQRRQTTAGSIEAEYLAAEQKLRLFYEFDAGTFSTAGDWKYLLHTGGATYRAALDKDGRYTAFLSGSASWRANGSSWAAADYRAVSLMANVQVKPRETATVRFGYRADVRRFPDLGELDQTQQDGFASLLVNLPSRTTVIGEAHLGVKSYAATTYVVPGTVAGDPVPGMGGKGRGMGPGLRASASGGGTITQENLAGQVVWLGRIAQSLADRTGVTLQYLQRSTFGRVPPAVITTPALFFDDGVYDDPFASNAKTVSAGLKHEFAGGMVIEGTVSRMRKDYNGALALDFIGDPLAGEPLRSDRVWRANAGWTIPLFPEKTGPIGVDLTIDYFYGRHRSNDAFYNYQSHGLALGATFAY